MILETITLNDENNHGNYGCYEAEEERKSCSRPVFPSSRVNSVEEDEESGKQKEKGTQAKLAVR